ncbi:MAG: restriction endonuclease [Bacteroidetes bacterium]|jgi:hypothetical protein|nr:restriction endonuclease [Bacteroidota bacterium]
MIIDSSYFKEYREKLGYTNQSSVKSFFAAKDINPTVDYQYIELLNTRLKEIVEKLNTVVQDDLKLTDLDSFLQQNINLVFESMKVNDILPRLRNQGRRPEEVYYNWMRGFVISNYFKKAISLIFEVDEKEITTIGDDDFANIDTFKRTPKADLEINLTNGNKVRIEVQVGFQGINDIKQHKVLEAKKIKLENNISTFVIHFDLFNGQVAFVKVDEINDDDVNWITRQQMEGQTVFNIEQNYFLWKLIDLPPKMSDINFN